MRREKLPMDAPLYQALAALAKKDSLRMHMPGHTAPRPAAHRPKYQ